MRLFIFGYGSLVSAENMMAFRARHGLTSGAEFEATLLGYRRDWSIAMDNSVDIPRYKYYLDAETGVRPDGFFAFLNVYASPGHFVNGRVLEVQESDLEAFDVRERNYDRVDVTDLMVPAVPGKCMTYVGTAAAKARAREGRQTRTLYLVRDYLDLVTDAFRDAGRVQADLYAQSTDPHDAPVRDVRRVEIPG